MPASRITHHGGPALELRCPDVMSSNVMMPIVFCASPVPCASDTIDAEIVWPYRNPSVTALRRARAVILYARNVPSRATTPQTSGDATAGSRIFDTTVLKCTAPDPDAIHTAPISPPNRACDEDDGSPSSQVTRFHRMAPTRPPKMIAGVTLVSSPMPPEIVLATAVE